EDAAHRAFRIGLPAPWITGGWPMPAWRSSAPGKLQGPAEHALALGFEVLGAEAVGIDNRADSLMQAFDRPAARLSRVAAVALQESLFKLGAPQPLLVGQAHQVGGRCTVVETAEIDDLQVSMVAQPVARLPVAVGWNQPDRPRPVGPQGLVG